MNLNIKIWYFFSNMFYFLFWDPFMNYIMQIWIIFDPFLSPALPLCTNPYDLVLDQGKPPPSHLYDQLLIKRYKTKA